jgi:hypothetical protein
MLPIVQQGVSPLLVFAPENRIVLSWDVSRIQMWQFGDSVDSPYRYLGGLTLNVTRLPCTKSR